ncbi:hypothetical protein CGGC5_v005869 [Colletotrichum fructicola Nara gc5]|uniref:Uncharacterized protein n=1 Tax=Colletotrichum fructicola (strain Nara gc5) TaxID=1213859 RepID=A0A7J6J7Q5_COLFN|nr:hypothetical protein CGGC5_v005869 [Colletotrichum fructicola Nara gc5]
MHLELVTTTPQPRMAAQSAKVESAKVDVFTEREYSDGRQAEFINQLFTLRIAYYPPTLVYFRLSPKVDGLCRWDDVSSSHPDDARQRLGGASDLTRLRFKLLSGMSAQIIVPKDSNGFKTPDSAAQHAVHLFASLASSPSFCVYFPRNKVQKSLLEQCVWAVPQFSGLNEDDRRNFQRKVDPKRLYGGKGGRVLTPDEYEDSSGTDGERSRSTTPATNPSNGSTVDFDSVPRPEGLPPQYGECLVESLRWSCTARPRLESEGAGMDVCMVFRELTSRLDDQQQQIKQLLHEQSEQQLSQEQLKALQDQIGKLKRQNAELKRRNSELENTCAELTNRQETADEERESMWLDISELQEVTGEHGKQLADNPKLAEDLASFIWGDGFQGPVSEPMKEHLDDLVKEYLDRICEGDLIKLLRECVQKKVASQMDEMKARMCETFK